VTDIAFVLAMRAVTGANLPSALRTLAVAGVGSGGRLCI
jgi:hypothetical protein